MTLMGPQRTFDASDDAPSSTLLGDQLASLAALANDLAGEFRLEPLLDRILRNAVELLDCESGSICTIDEAARSYRKEVDIAVGCHSGEVFPLEEGVTGAVVRANGPVTFERYSLVPGGHIAPGDPRYEVPVIGVPIRLNATLIGACVVFGTSSTRVFDRTDVELLGLFATHAAVAIANSRLHTATTERMRAAAVTAERERTMRDVHDTVGRGLASVLLHLDGAIGDLDDGTGRTAPAGDDEDAGRPPLRQELALARQAASEALDETKRTVLGLGPSVLDRCTLEDALRQELARAARMSTLHTQFLSVGTRHDIAPDVSQQLFRIVQESLANVVAHAQAATVRLGLVYGSEGVAAIVEDDGCGFDHDHIRRSSTEPSVVRNLGLSGLLARAHQVGGRVQIDSTPGWGTRVRADLPYTAATTDDEPLRHWRVVIVHDQPAMRAGLVRLLAQAEPGIRVVGELADATRVVDAITLLRPDVVLADIALQGASGAELVRTLRSADPDAAVVLLVGSPDDDIREAAAAGARGFVERTVDAVSLGRAIVSAATGDALVASDVLRTLGGWPKPESDVDDSGLTPREREVRALVERGLPDKRIAVELAISVKTVEKHVGTILRKTGAHNRTMLAALAVR
ncbi:hybrid sensor histidine kinase/response regulator transcription factor [Compostimonas suwonensis]|uniref:DNA-binding NarL/FixJ family response regulator n=1 Tax=Compostimonas suwonensis TaxID=1048394 RepID=A0A2M9C362_9MICO|nr:response regulator [Compostimonas suwonensis]PJJ64993.1 DNA-binding NarL/FixJ family response regulator [Compostimonas suwonensis]